MCGIAGYLFKEPHDSGPIGRTLISLLAVLGSRGTDGTGVALYTDLPANKLVARIYLGGAEPADMLAERVLDRIRDFATVVHAEVRANSLRLVLEYDGPLACLADTLEGKEPHVKV